MRTRPRAADQSTTIVSHAQLDVQIYHFTGGQLFFSYSTPFFKPLRWKKICVCRWGLLLIACILKFFTNWHLWEASAEWLKADFVELQNPHRSSSPSLASPLHHLYQCWQISERSWIFLNMLGGPVSNRRLYAFINLRAAFYLTRNWRQSQNVSDKPRLPLAWGWRVCNLTLTYVSLHFRSENDRMAWLLVAPGPWNTTWLLLRLPVAVAHDRRLNDREV